MRFWMRELAGWMLVGVGLYLFLIAITLLLDPEFNYPHFIESSAMIMIGFIVFRGGIHLLKVAIAARVCMHAEGELRRQSKQSPRRTTRPAPWEE